MLSIGLNNIQAIEDAFIEIEENTIVEFTGDNSNGKSIVSKVIQALTSGDICHKDVRNTLIKDNCDQGAVLFTCNNKQLGLILNRELKDSYVCYNPNAMDEKATIFRGLNDKDGWRQFLIDFGFRTYADGDICLQLSPTWGSIPFVTTSGSVNNSIVQDITVDKVAEEFLKSFSTITYPAIKNRVADIKNQKGSVQTILDNLEYYDWHKFEDIHSRMSKVYEVLRHCNYIDIEEINVPSLNLIEVNPIVIKEIPITNIIEPAPIINSIDDALDKLLSVLNGVCPTCGKPLFDNNHEGE